MANKQVPTVKNQHATAEELLEAVFSVIRAPQLLLCNGIVNTYLQQQLNYNNRTAISMWAVPRVYKRDKI
jgi:hypothetical protein